MQDFVLKLILLTFIVSTVLVSSPVVAHQQKEAYSTILFNERADTLEVHHRFYLHDAEHALKETTGESLDLTYDTESQLRFSDYLLSHFRLRVKNHDLTLDLVGHEIEGKYFWVYQEARLPLDLTSLEVAMTALQEVWPSQVNHINVEHNQQISSARLHANDGLTKIILKTKE